MKTYVCDACKTVVGDPYKVKMKEFMYTAEYDFGFIFPVETEFRKKLHLCGRCFDNLRKIAMRKEGAE